MANETNAAEVFGRASVPERAAEPSTEAASKSTAAGSVKPGVRSHGIPAARFAPVFALALLVVFVALWLKSPTLALVLVLALVLLPLLYWLVAALFRRGANRRRRQRDGYADGGYSRTRRESFRRPSAGPGSRNRSSRAPSGSRMEGARNNSGRPSWRSRLRDRMDGRESRGAQRTSGDRSSRSSRSTRDPRARGSRSDTSSTSRPSWRDRRAQRRAQRPSLGGGPAPAPRPLSTRQQRRAERRQQRKQQTPRIDKTRGPCGTSPEIAEQARTWWGERKQRRQQRRAERTQQKPEAATSPQPRRKKLVPDDTPGGTSTKKGRSTDKPESADAATETATASRRGRWRQRREARRRRRNQPAVSSLSADTTTEEKVSNPFETGPETQPKAKRVRKKVRDTLKAGVATVSRVKHSKTGPDITPPDRRTEPPPRVRVPFQEPGSAPQLEQRPRIAAVPFQAAPLFHPQMSHPQPIPAVHNPRGKSMTVTAKELSNPFVHMIDRSTPATLSTSLINAAGAARRSAMEHTETAKELRRQADALKDNGPQGDARDALLAEARRADETAEQHTGMAVGWETSAANVAAV